MRCTATGYPFESVACSRMRVNCKYVQLSPSRRWPTRATFKLTMLEIRAERCTKVERTFQIDVAVDGCGSSFDRQTSPLFASKLQQKE